MNNNDSKVLNLGIGLGFSVREVLNTAKDVTNRVINETISDSDINQEPIQEPTQEPNEPNETNEPHEPNHETNQELIQELMQEPNQEPNPILTKLCSRDRTNEEQNKPNTPKGMVVWFFFRPPSEPRSPQTGTPGHSCVPISLETGASTGDARIRRKGV